MVKWTFQRTEGNFWKGESAEKPSLFKGFLQRRAETSIKFNYIYFLNNSIILTQIRIDYCKFYEYKPQNSTCITKTPYNESKNQKKRKIISIQDIHYGYTSIINTIVLRIWASASNYKNNLIFVVARWSLVYLVQ